MMTLDMLARMIGCTLADLDDLGILPAPARCDSLVSDATAGKLCARWTEAQK